MKKNNNTTTNFTSETLQTTPETGTMESVTQNNAVKSPNSDPKQPELKVCVYTVEEVAQMLAISLRSAYNLCNATKDFRVLRIGTSIRVNKQSFDSWFAAL